MVRWSVNAATGMTSSDAPRARSEKMTIGSLRTRSSSTPACSDTSANGSVSRATRMPICNGVACSSSAAVSGSARLVICAPNAVTVSEIQSFRKSGERQSPRNERRNQRCKRSIATPVGTATHAVPPFARARRMRAAVHLDRRKSEGRKGLAPVAAPTAPVPAANPAGQPGGVLLEDGDAGGNAAARRGQAAHAIGMHAPAPAHACARLGGVRAGVVVGGHGLHPRISNQNGAQCTGWRGNSPARCSAGGARSIALSRICHGRPEPPRRE